MEALRSIVPEEFEVSKVLYGRSREPGNAASNDRDADGDFIMTDAPPIVMFECYGSSQRFTHSEYCTALDCQVVEGLQSFATAYGFPRHLPKRVHYLRGEWLERCNKPVRMQDDYKQPGPSPLRQEMNYLPHYTL